MAATIGAIVLTACSAPEPRSPSVYPSASTSQASRSELLVEARATYLRYLTDLQAVSDAGNKGFERLKPYLSDEAYESEVASFAELDSRGLHGSGHTKLAKFTLQKVDPDQGTISAYACLDFSSVRVLNTKGKDVTPTNRPSLQTFVPRFALTDGRLILEKNGSWSGDSVC